MLSIKEQLVLLYCTTDDLLPWVKKQKLYDERPKCLVERDWLKLALRDLRLL